MSRSPPRVPPSAACAHEVVAHAAVGVGRNQRVWTVVSAIPRGRVATYRQVASLAGIEGPTAARQVGYALAALKPGNAIPWHRVINAQGTVSRHGLDGHGNEQYERLALEGVPCDARGHIDLATFEWDYGG
jgi:methylated-DNA-protein-cysteine methyltransferase-like protein